MNQNEPQAERAMVRLVEIFSAMSGTRYWGGSYPNPPIVLRELKQPDQVNQCPTICLKEESGSEFNAEEPLATAGAELIMTDRFHLAIWAHVKADPEMPASTWLLRLREDIRRTLLLDFTLGGIARGMAFGPEEVDGGLLEPRALLVMPITLILDGSYVDP
jgi:hypothetical protein